MEENKFYQYVALFRGVNVGGHNKLPMKILRALLEGLGYSNIRTYIQSGNVVFDSVDSDRAKIAQSIRVAIKEAAEITPQLLLLNAGFFMEAAKQNTFPTDEGKSLHLYFLDTQPSKMDWEALDALKAEGEAFEVIGQVFYLYTPNGFGRSKLASRAENCLGVSATARNWNTVSKILAMLES